MKVVSYPVVNVVLHRFWCCCGMYLHAHEINDQLFFWKKFPQLLKMSSTPSISIMFLMMLIKHISILTNSANVPFTALFMRPITLILLSVLLSHLCTIMIEKWRKWSLLCKINNDNFCAKSIMTIYTIYLKACSRIPMYS